MSEIAELFEQHSKGLISDEAIIRRLMKTDVIFLASYDNPEDTKLTVHNFVFLDGVEYIPIFLDSAVAYRRRPEMNIDTQARFLKGKGEKFFDMLSGSERIFIDFGTDQGTTLYASDIKSIMELIRAADLEHKN